MNGLWEASRQGNKLTIRQRPHAGQWRALTSERRFIAMLAGTQAGKTSAGPLWLEREIRRCGPGDYLGVTSTFPLLKLKMLPEFLLFFRHTLKLGTYQASDRVFTFHDGKTRIIFGSATHPESLESATAKAAWLDEAGQDQFKIESWEAILRRLSLAQGRVLVGTTLYNLGWLKQQIYDPWLRGDPDIEVIQFQSTLNPAFPLAEFERARKTLPTWKFDLFYRGQYAKPAGLIYGDYRDEYREHGGHLVRPFEIPSEWSRHVGVDFGAINTALVWLARDPDSGERYVYREYLAGGKTTPGHAADAQALSKGETIRSWHGGAKSEVQQRLDWKAAGIPVQEPPFDNVEAGLDRVIEGWKTDKLFIFDTCLGIRDELGTYSREVDEVGEPTEKIKDKASFHRLDALRYVIIGGKSKRLVTW